MWGLPHFCKFRGRANFGRTNAGWTHESPGALPVRRHWAAFALHQIKRHQDPRASRFAADTHSVRTGTADSRPDGVGASPAASTPSAIGP